MQHVEHVIHIFEIMRKYLIYTEQVSVRMVPGRVSAATQTLNQIEKKLMVANPSFHRGIPDLCFPSSSCSQKNFPYKQIKGINQNSNPTSLDITNKRNRFIKSRNAYKKLTHIDRDVITRKKSKMANVLCKFNQLSDIKKSNN